MSITLDIERIAHVCHEANRALQVTEGDPAVSPHFMDAPEWQVASALRGVAAALEGATQRQLHGSWMDFKERGGWTWGPHKSESEKTHPCMVPYDDLPADQQLKDLIFSAIVGAFKSTAEHAAMRARARAAFNPTNSEENK